MENFYASADASKTHLVIGGEETEDEEEVGVEDVIQRPDHIRRVIDHEVGSDHLRHVLLVRPLLVEVALLLVVKDSDHCSRDQDPKRSKSRTPPSERRDGGCHSATKNRQQTHTRTRAMTEPRNTFSRQLPTATRRRDAIASTYQPVSQVRPKRRRKMRKPAQSPSDFRKLVRQVGTYVYASRSGRVATRRSSKLHVLKLFSTS